MATKPEQAEGLLLVGVVGQPRGLKGEVRIKSFTSHPGDIGSYGELVGEEGKGSYRIRVTGRHKESVLAMVEGINDRTAAEGIRGLKLFVRREQMPALEEDEFYFTDLVGLAVELEDGSNWGRVVLADDFGAGPVLEIERPDGKTAMVPFSREVVPVVDLENSRVVVVPPDGLDEPGTPEPAAAGDEEEGDTEEQQT